MYRSTYFYISGTAQSNDGARQSIVDLRFVRNDDDAAPLLEVCPTLRAAVVYAIRKALGDDLRGASLTEATLTIRNLSYNSTRRREITRTFPLAMFRSVHNLELCN